MLTVIGEFDDWHAFGREACKRVTSEYFRYPKGLLNPEFGIKFFVPVERGSVKERAAFVEGWNEVLNEVNDNGTLDSN